MESRSTRCSLISPQPLVGDPRRGTSREGATQAGYHTQSSQIDLVRLLRRKRSIFAANRNAWADKLSLGRGKGKNCPAHCRTLELGGFQEANYRFGQPHGAASTLPTPGAAREQFLYVAVR